ncbi:DUF5753 domain-containing protein [Streptomyces sp. NPDC102467]|uniref:DUF5753 domain-containing protein n=1 Tax=Streptomyces sp. NPDC102467 TaxID=3366179 RepID=UPI00382CC326
MAEEVTQHAQQPGARVGPTHSGEVVEMQVALGFHERTGKGRAGGSAVALGQQQVVVQPVLLGLAGNGRERGWWSQYEGGELNPHYADYIALEWDASDLYVVETSLIPGLLQTPAYTEAVIRMQSPNKADDFDYVQEQVKVRGQRRQVFARSVPLRLWAIVAESALRHRVGGPEVMREQLEALLSPANETNIQIQVLPTTAPINSALYGPFGILAFPEPAETDVVYADSLMSTVYYEQPDQVDSFTTLFRRLNSEALPVEESLARIRAAIQEMDSK